MKFTTRVLLLVFCLIHSIIQAQEVLNPIDFTITPISSTESQIAKNKNTSGKAMAPVAIYAVDESATGLSAIRFNSPFITGAPEVGDRIVFDGSIPNRLITTVEVILFHQETDIPAPIDLQINMYTDCPSQNGAPGAGFACGSGPGTLIPNSTLQLPQFFPPNGAYRMTFTYPTPVNTYGLGDEIVVTFKAASASDVFIITNIPILLGSNPTDEPVNGWFTACGEGVVEGGCNLSNPSFTNNNFAFNLGAEEDLTSPNVLAKNIIVTLDPFSSSATITPQEVDNGSSDAEGNITLSVSPNTFNCDDLGDNNVFLTVTDQAGNVAQTVATVTVLGSGPIISCGPDLFVDADPTNCNAIVTFTSLPQGNDSCAPVTVTQTVGPSSGSLFPIGQTIVGYQATSVNGTANCAYVVTVRDVTPPVVSCRDIVVALDNTGNASITAADITGFDTNDSCGIASSMIDISNFTIANTGSNNVTLTVEDPSGNVASCVAFVTVIAPVELVNTTPATHAINVDPAANIVMNFNTITPAEQINLNTIVVTGSQTGVLEGTLSGVGTTTVTFNPTQNFKPGEIITVNITANAVTNPTIRTFTTIVPILSIPANTSSTRKIISNTAMEVFSSVTGDIDGDGDLDIISASVNDDTIAWYENDGTASPSFSENLISTTANGAINVTVGDVNGDGHLDIVAALANEDSIVWYENDGAANPSFTAHIVSTNNDSIRSVVVADINNDGMQDIIAGSVADTKIAWYENNGGANPSFSEYIISSLANGILSVSVADIDADGDMDVLGALSSNNTVIWYENDGNTNPFFTENIVTTNTNGVASVTTADLDNDGDLDIVTASQTDDKIAWFENNGAIDPLFTEQVITTTADIAFGIHTADINGDSFIDVLSASVLDDTIAWYENDGNANPTFTKTLINTASDGARSVTSGDLNGDGDLDIIAASQFDNTIAWFETQTNRNLLSSVPSQNATNIVPDANLTLTFNTPLPDALTNTQNIAVTGSQTGTLSGVFTGGNTTTITFNPSQDFKPGEVISISITDNIVINSSVISFTVNTPVQGLPADETSIRLIVDNSPVGLSDAITGDMDNDGDLDIIAVSSGDNTLAWYENDGNENPSFIKRTISTTANGVFEVAVGDINGDGHLDIVTGSFNAGTTIWYENDGATAPSFTARTVANNDTIGGVAIADINNDGLQDIITSSVSIDNKLIWYENNGGTNPSFTEHFITTSLLEAFANIRIADIDGDGDLDVLGSFLSSPQNLLFWYENDGTTMPSFTQNAIATTNPFVSDLTTADLDRDGDLDMITSSLIDNTISWFENNGAVDPVFTEQIITTTVQVPDGVHAADINGNGFIDILSASFSDDTIALYLNDGNPDPSFTKTLVNTVSDGALSLFSGDLDGDGDLDILSASRNDNTLAWHETTLRSITYNSGDYIETSSNNGAVEGDATIVLNDATFANPEGTLTSPTHFTINNLPAGLVPVLAINDDGTVATLIVTGNATVHESSDSITNLNFTFEDSAFTSNLATGIENTIAAESPMNVSFSNEGSPTVVISTTVTNPTVTNPVPITISFSEEVSGFEMTDILVSNGTITTLSTTDNITYTTTIIPIATGIITIDIPAEAAQDIEGNPNFVADQLSIDFAFVINDVLSAAIPLTVYAPDMSVGNETSADTTNATASPQSATSCDSFGTNLDLFYEFTVPVDQSRILVFTEGPKGNNIELVLRDVTTGVEISGTCQGQNSFHIIDNLVNGTTYILQVWHDSLNAGAFTIALETPPPPPINDEPTGAIPITVGSSFLEFPLIGTNLSSTNSTVLDPTIPAPSCANFQGGDVWYTVVVPVNGELTVQGSTAGGPSDFGMAIYSGNVGSLNLLECDDDDGPGAFPSITLTGQTPGDTLFIRFWEFGNNSFGDFQITAVSSGLCAGITTTFDGTNWNSGVPGPNDTAIIAGDYNTLLNGNLDVCTLQVQAGIILTVADDTFVQTQSNISIDGTLNVSNTGSIVQKGVTAGVANNGSISISKITPTLDDRNFVAMSSPVTAEARDRAYGNSRAVFSIIPSNFVPFVIDLGAFPEFSGAENFLDDNNDYLLSITGNTALPDPGIGQLVFPQPEPNVGDGAYTITYTQNPTNPGTLNSGKITVPINYNGPATINNYNLLGNPYASAIDVTEFINANNAVNEVYYWDHLTNPTSDLPGFGSSNFSMNDISIRNALLGIAAINGGTAPGQFMASGQGFGIKANQLEAAENTPVVFTNSIRVTGNNDGFRNAENSNIDRLWLNLTTEAYEEATSQTGIGFTENATQGYDAGYDSPRLGTFISLFTTLETGQQLSIQGRETFDPEIALTLGFATSLETEENYTISIDHFEGIDIENAPIFLIDNLNNTVTNLKENSYVFIASKGIQPDRFTVLFQERDVLDTDEFSFRESVTLYPNPATDQVTLGYVGEAQLQQLSIIDVNGKVVRNVSLENFQHLQVIDTSRLANGIYFLKIQSTQDTIVQKLMIR